MQKIMNQLGVDILKIENLCNVFVRSVSQYLSYAHYWLGKQRLYFKDSSERFAIMNIRINELWLTNIFSLLLTLLKNSTNKKIWHKLRFESKCLLNIFWISALIEFCTLNRHNLEPTNSNETFTIMTQFENAINFIKSSLFKVQR